MSEELEALERVKKFFPFKVNELEYLDICIIETALKAFDIIKEKRVDVGWLISCENIEQYNNVIGTATHKLLTQEDFVLLKKVSL